MEKHPFDEVAPDSLTALLASSKQVDPRAFFREDQSPDPIEFRLPGASVRGTPIVKWQIQPVRFLDALVFFKPGEDVKKADLPRLVHQTRAFDEHGIAYELTEDDFRAMPYRTVARLIQALHAFGDEKAPEQPKATGGDGISAPAVVRLGKPVAGVSSLTFECETYADLEVIGNQVGDLETRFFDLLSICDDGHVADFLTPMDGWFLLGSVLKPMQEKARKILKAARSYEYVMQAMLPRDISVGVLNDRLLDYAKNHEAKAKAMQPKPGQGAGKRRGKRRR